MSFTTDHQTVRPIRSRLTNTQQGEAIKINMRLKACRVPAVMSGDLAATILGIVEARSTRTLPAQRFADQASRAYLAVRLVARGAQLRDLDELAEQIEAA